MVAGHACPVPGCGRYVVEDNYVSGADIQLVLAPSLAMLSKTAQGSSVTHKKPPKKHPSNDNQPLSRHAAARAAILKAIEQKQRP